MKSKLLLIVAISVYVAIKASAQSLSQQVISYQYYFNTDPGQGVAGNGAIIPVSPTSDYNATVPVILPGNLGNGLNNLFVKAQDEDGNWSMAEHRAFFIQPIYLPLSVTAYQYFFDTDPGLGIAGNGAVIAVSSTTDYNATVAINVPALSNGMHNLFVRVKDDSGKWSMVEHRTFFIEPLYLPLSVTAYQYYFDTDPGVGIAGNGAIIPVSSTTDYNATVTIVVPALSNGMHNLFIRVKDDSGKWSIVEHRTFFIEPLYLPLSVTAYQYYFDTDPGVGIAGNGAIIPISTTIDYNATVTIIVPALSNGVHNLFIRAKDNSGKWSIVEHRTFFIEPLYLPLSVTAYQYYFDTDPGVGVAGDGSIVPVTATADFNNTVTIVTPALSNGLHTLFVRAKDDFGRWGIPEHRVFYIQTVNNTQTVNALEYFFDTDPGTGNGNPIPVNASANINNVFPIAVPCLSNGTHRLYVRAKDQFNRWSIIERGTVTVTSGISAAAVTPAGPLTICSSDSVTLSAPFAAGVVYQWLLNGSNIPSANTNTYIVHAAGNYSLKTTCGASFVTSNVVTVSTLPLLTFYADSDGDGFGNAASTTQACTQPPGYVSNNTDCNDNDNSVHVVQLYYVDADGDGFGSTTTAMLCSSVAPAGYSTNNTDCNDGNVAIHALVLYYADADGDGFGSTTSAMLCSSTAPAGYSTNNTDCNDNNIAIYQNATFYIDMDNDGYDNGTSLVCYGATIPAGYSTTTLGSDCSDNDVTVHVVQQYYVDGDHDGYGSVTTAMVCASTPPVGYANNNTDCNDGDATVHALQSFYIDTDHDGFGSNVTAMLCASSPPTGYSNNNTDCNDADATVHAPQLYYVDGDGDGYGSATTAMLCSSTAPAGYSLDNTDCNDNDVTVHIPQLYYVDGDQDGFGSTNTAMLCSSTAPLGYATNNTDCNDADAAVHVPFQYYVDTDHDGYGSVLTAVLCSSTPPVGYSNNNTDCNDNNISIYQSSTLYVDADGDGYNNGTSLVCYGAIIPTGYASTTLGNDCNDNDATVHVPQQYYVDADHDTYGSATTAMLCSSTAPSGYSTNSLDCNDANANVNPGATEVCNNVDDDCDGLIDDNDPSVTGQPSWYADVDGDGFGDPAVSQNKCIQPVGYISNSTDCDDTDPLEHPGQVWYIDHDDDDYGTGATVIQCLRPAHGYLAGELTATTGDCNDNNPNINPVSQTLSFSGVSGFTNSLVNPLNGTSYTNFAFEVIYTDATNSLPPATFPRVMLDYEGNGIFTDPNDRTVIMSAYDANDLNTSDGKRYIGTINSLASGTNWKARVQVINGSCITQIGPFNYPDVLILPDLQIFANDITFSSANLPVSSSQTVSAVIHNESDFAAQNFYAHLVNQYDNTSTADILVSNLAPHSSTTVTWNITTPAVPAWCPMQVSIDHTNVIDESNELDNSAIRPFINGNFNLPGGIVVVNAATSPSVAYTSNGSSTTASGRGFYYGTPVPLSDSSVAGGTVSFTITETNATYTTNTNSQGYFSFTFPSPIAIGTYHITGTLTDYTFTANWSASFTIIPAPVNVCLPDLRAFVNLSSYNIVEGNSISGNITVYNFGCAATTVNTILDISQSGGTPALADVIVPPLAVGASFVSTFSGLTFNSPGTYSICGTADGTYLEDESNESNNTDCKNITVIPAQPDIYSANGPCCSAYICNAPSNPSFVVGNSGGVSTGTFTCNVIVRLNNTILTTLSHSIANINAQSSISFSIPFTYPSVGNYTFELQCDVPLPDGIVVETNENNNAGTYATTILDCRPDLVLYDCELFDVQPVDPQFPGAVTYVTTMSNAGNATAFGPIDVRFHLSGGTDYDTQYMGNLTPGQSTVVSVNVPSVAPATQMLTASADPFNTITEWSESNSVINSLCWDFEPVPMYYPCGSNFWDANYLVNQIIYLSVGLNNYNMYDASTVKVRFEVSGPGLVGTVNLGNALVSNVQQTCNCPRNAVLPVSFAFPQVGTYTFTMTADPDGDYTECNEGNNVLVRTVTVTAIPDMRIVSQFINPSLLNPDIGQPITLDVTYENIGYSNINDQMELRVLIDEVPLDSVYPVSGLVTGDNATISIPASWSSNVPGSHIIRAKIDNDNQVVESNESNNAATRAVVVGQAANLYFQVFAASNPSPSLHTQINLDTRIGNNGDVDCEADVQYFYLTNQLDTIQVGVLHVSVDANDSTTIQLPWMVLDNSTTLIAKIINSSVLEYTYDDNQATTIIGGMTLSFTSTQSCNGNSSGTLTANPSGGEPPYSYLWNNGFNSQILTAVSGNYTVTVTDNTGQNVSGSSSITNDPGITYYADADADLYGDPASILIACSPPPGYVLDHTDCNDNDAMVHTPIQYYVDADHDGYGSTLTAMLCSSTAPTGYSLNNTDCNDNDATVHAPIQYYIDADHDGYGSTLTAMLCSSTAPTGYSVNNTDCNDNDPTVHAPVQYYVDADHDGYGSTTTAMLCSSTAPTGYSVNNTDCNDNDATFHAPIQYYVDIDHDGYGSSTISMLCSSTAPTGYSVNNTDCNDNDATVHAPIQYYVDADHDGYGSTATAMLCSSTAPTGYSVNNTDCNDNDATVHAPIQYYVDSDHDGYGSNATAMLCSSTASTGYSVNNTDCNDNDATVHAPIQYYVDSDHDGYGSTATAMLCSSTAPTGYSVNNTDCNDNDATVHAPIQYYVDSDHDGYGSTTTAMLCSSTAPTGYSVNNTDCNDNDATVHAPIQYYVDADHDGYGSTATAILCSSTAPTGYSVNNTDCNDNNAAIHAPVQYYVDADHDGYGSTATSMQCSSIAPTGYSANNTDCNDNDATVHVPIQYYVDADHDGYGSATTSMVCSSTAPTGYSVNNTDCNDNNAVIHAPVQYYVDVDHDGYGSTTAAMLCASTAPTGYSTNNTDCNDNNANVRPGATETCGNGMDDNCNGQIDEGCTGPVKFMVVDICTDKGYKYDASFNLVSVTLLASANADPNDATTNGTNSYVLDGADKKVYRYTGTTAVSKTLRTICGTVLGSPAGVAISGNDMWVVDDCAMTIYKYSLIGAFSSTGTINAITEIPLTGNNADASGLSIDANYLYVLDPVDKKFYRYPRTCGGGVASKVMKETNGNSLGTPVGAAMDGTAIWVVDSTKDKAYQFTLSSLFSGTGNLNASSQYPLNSLNKCATGIAVGNSSNLLKVISDEPIPHLEAFPNPSAGKVNLRFNLSIAETFRLTIVDMEGGIVSTDLLKGIEGVNLLEIDIGSEPKGIFLIILENDHFKINQKIILQ